MPIRVPSLLRVSCLLAASAAAAATLSAAQPAAPPYRIELSTLLVGRGKQFFSQSRGTLIPGHPARVMITTQETDPTVTHGFGDLYRIESTDNGWTWTPPRRVEPLRRKRMPEGHDFVIGDVSPQWHAATRVVLATGKTFGFRGGTEEDRGLERVSYAVYSPQTDAWSELRLLELPSADHAGRPLLEANSGGAQRVDRPNGEILLPIRYRKDPAQRYYTSIVARCRFDGQTLTYLEHGSEFTLLRERGLYEPSIVEFKGEVFLTLRADHSAFVARSKDGITYQPMAEWTFDDGQVLGNYNSQQHWLTHHDALYLIYTRRGANNDHVLRHRAPLFIAQVDPARLQVVRRTERVLVPESNADIASGFGVIVVSP